MGFTSEPAHNLHYRGIIRLLGEDTQQKVALLVGTECGGQDDIVAGRQAEPGRHLAQVYERLAPCTRGVVSKKMIIGFFLVFL